MFFPSILVAAMGELFNSDFDNEYSITSFVFSIYLMFASLLFVLAVTVISIRHSAMRKHPYALMMFTSLVTPFKKWFLHMFFYPFHLV